MNDPIKHDIIDDGEFEQKVATRRKMLASAGRWAAGLAAVAAPGAVGLLGKRAFAQSNGVSPEDILNYALTLEYLEADYYTQGVASGVLSADLEGIFTEIRDHEVAHVRLLEDALGLQEDEKKPSFDFTAGGNFDPFGNEGQFLLLAQGFEDTGVRAYKGQAPNLVGNAYLTTALQIHSVEARHASIVRRVRGEKGWITRTEVDAPANTVQAVYAGEDVTTQGGVNLSSMLSDFSDAQITESFDEPLSMSAVNAIAGLFLASS